MARINNEIRNAMSVATAVAEEVMNNLMQGREFLSPQKEIHFIRPVLVEYTPKKSGSECLSSTRFFFESGIEIVIHMQDSGYRNGEHWIENWEVIYVTIRYYESPEAREQCLPKIFEEWSSCELRALKARRPWWHPNILDFADVTGEI